MSGPEIECPRCYGEIVTYRPCEGAPLRFESHEDENSDDDEGMCPMSNEVAE